MATRGYEEIGKLLGASTQKVKDVYGHNHPDYLKDATTLNFSLVRRGYVEIKLRFEGFQFSSTFIIFCIYWERVAPWG